MRIKKINLYTDQLEANREFFASNLGLELVLDEQSRFTVRVGWSELSFTYSPEAHNYHYCFLIPSNKIHEALDWMQRRVPILEVEKGEKIQRFESWNAESFYFYDGSGNLAECIARYDLNNRVQKQFSSSDLLAVNEIGFPTKNIEETDRTLSEIIGSLSWKGDLHRFGTHGDQEGLILLPNYKVKKTWFPTDREIRPESFEATLEQQGEETSLAFRKTGIKRV